MSDVEHFALLVLVVGVAIVAAVLLSRISERIRIPAPAILLVAAAVASDVMPALGELSVTTVQRIVSVALAVILFDGGMQMGWQRFRNAARPGSLGRGCRHLRHRRRPSRTRPWPVRPGVAGGVAGRHGPGPHRPGGGFLGAGPPRGRRP